VVSPSIDLCLHFLKQTRAIGNAGDLCGGTGRFMHELHKKAKGFVFNQYMIADQSAFSIELARINFFIESISNASFHFVSDSITDDKLALFNSSFSIIATNPPFGTGKYLWSYKLNKIFKPDFLSSIGLSSNSPRIDPAEMFVYRNLQFLMEGGILGIVLPDGINDVFATVPLISNSPTTKPLLCKPGDILISCINPKIWRVTIIPNLAGSWSCSSEFAVLQPINFANTVSLFLSLISEDFIQQAVLLANGTSSSRQRINKITLLDLRINKLEVPEEIEDMLIKRKDIYKARLAELRLLLGDSAGLHKPDCKTFGL